MNKIFIHTNDKQILGAILSKYSIEKNLSDKGIDIDFINVDNHSAFKNFSGVKYLRGKKEVTYNPHDLQSFTLSRFGPPELMNFTGRAIVIDPDIFAVADISELFKLDLQGKSIAACRKNNAWDTSMMILDCSKLKHWKISTILEKLKNKEIDYVDIMSLKLEPEGSILEMPRLWNNLDKLTPDTKLLHTTNRITQPWRSGLPIDFTISPLPKIFGIIPREPIHKLLGKYPTHYLNHPDKSIESFFFKLASSALQNNVVTRERIQQEIDKGDVRIDFFKKLEEYSRK